ncbi:hypothetical protein D3C85_971190 [compost metagenome]
MLAMDSSAPRLSGSHALSLTTIAGKPAPTRDRVRVVFHAIPVGASLLAMDSSAPRVSGSHALSLTTIAAMRRPDKPAPAGDRARAENEAHKKGRCKRSGQSKTLDQELQINVSEHGVMNRILDSSEIFQSRRRLRGSQVRISPRCCRKNTNSRHALLQPRQQSGFGCSTSG